MFWAWDIVWTHWDKLHDTKDVLLAMGLANELVGQDIGPELVHSSKLGLPGHPGTQDWRATEADALEVGRTIAGLLWEANRMGG